jgi:hypothetical protein
VGGLYGLLLHGGFFLSFCYFLFMHSLLNLIFNNLPNLYL